MMHSGRHAGRASCSSTTSWNRCDWSGSENTRYEGSSRTSGGTALRRWQSARANRRGFGTWLVTAVLVGCITGCTAYDLPEELFYEAQTGGKTQLILSNNEVTDGALCGVTSPWLGKQNVQPFNVTIVTELTKETLCLPDLSEKVFFWPYRVFERGAEDPEWLQKEFPCITEKYIVGVPKYRRFHQGMMEFFLERNATGFMAHQNFPEPFPPEAMGILSTDDLRLKQYVDAPILVLECSIPKSWRSALGEGSATVELHLEELAFDTLFKSWWYELIFRWVFGFHYVSLGVHLLLRLFRDSTDTSKHRFARKVNGAILFLNGASMVYFGIVALLVEGWRSSGIIDSFLMDSFYDTFLSPVAASCLLVVLLWNQAISAITVRPESEPSPRKASLTPWIANVTSCCRICFSWVSNGFFWLLVAISSVSSALFQVLLMLESFTIANLYYPMAALNWLVLSCVSLYFMRSAWRLYYIVKDGEATPGSLRDGSEERMLLLRYRVVRVALSLAYFTLTWPFTLGSGVWSAPIWTWIWFNILLARLLLVYHLTALSRSSSQANSAARHRSFRVAPSPVQPELRATPPETSGNFLLSVPSAAVGSSKPLP